MAGVDFKRTFVFVAKFITIRCILALGMAMHLEIYQMDVKTTFFDKTFEVEIYMDQLEGFVQGGIKDLLCKLKKILYELKQFPKGWYHRIIPFFINKDFC
jgi:hypothetical protein